MSKAIVFRNHQNEKIYPCPYYPIGSIFLAVTNINPSNIFGGTWEQIKDRFLLCAGSTYSAGSTGGEATHKLTINEMPSHGHSLSKQVPYGVPYNNTSGSLAGNSGSGPYYGETYNPPWTVNNNGGNQAHNNMPPYIVVYMWKRIS